jgi:glycosyltransferase involved in cell wall biosynthesis
MPGVFDEAEVGVLREQYLRERTPLRRARHGLTWWKFRRYIASVIGRFDCTTVVSDREREHLRDLGCDSARIAVVPNGIAVPAIDIPVRRVPRLIYPGAVTYSANLDAVRYFVREILPLVRRSVPDLSFVVTGSTVDADIRDLTATEGVTFTGRLPDVSPFIAESAACVVPLRIGGGTRLKILHAMAVATPVVSTSKGIEGLEVEPERHVLVADTPETFAAQVVRVVRDPVLGSEIAMAARQLVRERYAWGPIGRTLEGVVESAVAERRFSASRGAGMATP